EVPARYRQQRLPLAVRVDRFVAVILAAPVHVRGEAEDAGVGPEAERGLGLVVRVVGWYLDGRVGELADEQFVLRPLFGEGDTDGGTILRRLAIGRVVHLETQLRSLGDAQGGVRRTDKSQVAGGPADQDRQVAVAADRALLSFLQDVHDDVMHH